MRRRAGRWRWAALACAATIALLAGFTVAGAHGGHRPLTHGYEVTTEVLAVNPGRAGEHGQAGDHGRGAANGQGLGVLDLDDRVVAPALGGGNDMTPGRGLALGHTDLGLPLPTPSVPTLLPGPPEGSSSGPGGSGPATTPPTSAPTPAPTAAPRAGRLLAAAPSGVAAPAPPPAPAPPAVTLPPLVLIPPLGLPAPPLFSSVSGGAGALPLVLVVVALVVLTGVLAVRVLRKSR